jgi:MSHA biogenesis protein MshQ
MGSRNGSQLRPLRIPVEAQYWNGTSFLTNVDDSCTTLAADNVALGNYQPNLNACETSVTVGAFAQGRSTIGLSAPGAGNSGSVDLTANLSAVNAGSTCIAGAATPALGANRLYLQGKWTGATYTQNPVSKATFGTYPGSDEVIFTRENF